MAIRFPTMAERPDLRPRARALMDVWPPFMHHDPVANQYFGRVRDQYDYLQFFAWEDELDDVVAEANVVPAGWDGDPESLPDEGLDAILEASFADRTSSFNVLSALQIVISGGYQGRGLSARMIERMAEIGRSHGYASLIAPVRPSWKHRYPLADIDRYVAWRRGDGSHVDPWLRTHERMGGEILRVAHRSMIVPGTVAEWEDWTEMTFPESGPYVVPGALVPIEIDLERGHGLYVEPNVWVLHRL
jgi:GNAT superfamily N-acetyltransferase